MSDKKIIPVKLTPIIQKAINIASEKHLGQKRKADGLPYIVHPFAVAWILSNYTDDEDVIAAGLLHDTLEDVAGYRFDDIKKDFGDRVANIVKEVSEDKDPNIITDEKATWEDRKRKYLKHLQVASREAMLVCCADKIHNLSSLLDVYKEQGDAVCSKFNAPADKILWFNGEVLRILQTRMDGEFVRELERIYTQICEKTDFSG
jgi:(p)ppGpp synthase/HD superfamily hydrolase